MLLKDFIRRLIEKHLITGAIVYRKALTFRDVVWFIIPNENVFLRLKLGHELNKYRHQRSSNFMIRSWIIEENKVEDLLKNLDSYEDIIEYEIYDSKGQIKEVNKLRK